MSATGTTIPVGGFPSVGDDSRSEYGGIFETAPTGGVDSGPRTQAGPSRGGAYSEGVVREQPAVAVGFGKGPVTLDKRKFKYDVTRAKSLPPVVWSASKVDRMDASDAGDLLHSIHEMLGIASEREDRLLGFDSALWYEHTVNGASQLQPGRGTLKVDGQAFDIAEIVKKLGLESRRFFRAFADDIAANNRRILDEYDSYDEESREKVGILRAIAAARGLSKFPHLVHDSSDACVDLSAEERNALLVSKRYYLPQTVNQADALLPAASDT